MTQQWCVYGIYVGRKLQYVGYTKNMKRREAAHSINLMAGRTFKMRPMVVGLTKSEASRLEAEAIRGMSPPMNAMHHPTKDRSTAQSVEVLRTTSTGDVVPVIMRLRAGVMHPDDARKIWHGETGIWSLPDRIANMAGWSMGQAYFIFGQP